MLFCLGLCLQSMAGETEAAQPTLVSSEIQTIIAAQSHPYLTQPGFLHRAEELDTLYRMNDYRLLWLGHPNSATDLVKVLNLFQTAEVNGLNPANYDVDTLMRQMQMVLTLEPTAYRQLALYDTALSLSLLRFLHDLHYGRVAPHGINFNLKLREKKLVDFPTLIKESLVKDTLSELPALVEPKWAQYQKLKEYLSVYRSLAKETPPITLVINKSIHPGDHFSEQENLRQFLVSTGDMPEHQSEKDDNSSTLYTGKMVDAVKTFQHRHGLNADGILGKGTAEAINTPLAQRVTQIELAMERLRWLPESNPDRLIIVNIPAFQLWAFNDLTENPEDLVSMKVVVGKALKNETPVLMAKLSFIDFMPYWNIPYSIAKDEILPKWIKDPDYLNKEEMELVNHFGNQVNSVEMSDTSIEQVKQGLLRIRQKPGKKNPLGRVKFIFPNKNDVYLHGTSANSLFSRSRRDFSHGCVRVEAPALLAEFALKNLSKWTKEQITLAMKSTKTERVILKKPIPVLFFYTTAYIDQKGSLEFYPDIYGHDAVLLGALQKKEDLSDRLLFVSSRSD